MYLTLTTAGRMSLRLLTPVLNALDQQSDTRRKLPMLIRWVLGQLSEISDATERTLRNMKTVVTQINYKLTTYYLPAVTNTT